jgi:hypothetical protein
MKINIRKTILTALISCIALVSNPKSAGAISAWVTNNINPVSNMNQILSDLGVDKQEMMYNIKTMNVSRQKKQPPQVSLSFDPKDPKPGQRVTVTATPIYFLNDPRDMYFTWYLQTAECANGNTTGKCDLNNDGRVDEEDWKIKATRIIVNDGFDWNNEINGNPEQANPQVYNNDDDSDGYYSVNGGDDQRGKDNSHCYYHDLSSGNEYEIAGRDDDGTLQSTCQGRRNHLFPHAPGKMTGDNSFGSASDLDEEKFWRTNPHSPDTMGSGNSDEANVAGRGITQFSWTYTAGDKVGVVVEGVSMESTQYKDSSYKIMWAFTKNKCDINIKPTSEYPKYEYSYSGPTDVGVGVTCPDTSPSPGALVQKDVKTTTKYDVISYIGNVAHIRTYTSYQDIIDANCDGQVDSDGHFTESPGSAYGSISTCEDPYTTCYPYDNASPPQTCPCTGLDATVDISAYQGTFAEVKDLNKCLEGNLIEPKEGGGAKEKMEVTLSYSPESPMNDPGTGASYNKDGDGDVLTVQSSIANADSSIYLKYDWQLYESDSPNPDFWTTILSTRLPDNLETSGFGLDDLKLRLDIPNLKKYLRIKLTVSENAAGTNDTRKGTTDIVIPVSSLKQRIRAYNTVVSDSLDLSRGNTVRCETVVNGQTQVDPICLVAKDEIITLHIDNPNGDLTDFLWTVNNKVLQPPYSQTPYGNTAFFPVLEDNGYTYTVELAATNRSGDKIDLVKTFEVADPAVQIASADEFVCKPNLLGHYVDLDGKYWPDLSKTNFSALSDTPIKLKAAFSGFIPTQDQYTWYVDGYEVNKDNAAGYGHSIDADGTITLIDKSIGQVYNVTVGYLFSQDKNSKNALTKYWGVSLDKFYEKKISSSVQIQFVGSISDTQGANKNNIPKKIIASIYSSTPAYIAFLLRIVLTAFAMIIFSKIILSFFPNLKENEY